MKTYRLILCTATARHEFTALARDGAEAFMLAWDLHPDEPMTIIMRGGRP